MCLMKLKFAAFTLMYGKSLKKFTHLEGCGIKGMWLIFKTKAPFTRDRIQMGSDPFGSDPLFEVRLHGIGSRIVGVYTRSDPFGFYELLAAF